MTSNRPYIIRALFEWIVDNHLTPYLLVNTDRDDVVVPVEYIEEHRIVLNVNPGAVQRLDLGNEWIIFSARFSGQPMDLSFPPEAVLGIYAKENGQGMLFPEEPLNEGPDGDDPGPQGPTRPSLKVVK